MMWIYIFILFWMESWSTTQGTTNSNTSMISNTTTPTLKVYVNKKAVFNLGSDAKLTCSQRKWNETMYVIWKIEIKNKVCEISLSNEGKTRDSCIDGKFIQNSSTGQSYLHIPNFSAKDVGFYKCESAYTGGNENYNIEVGVTAPPKVSAWLERRGNKMVAVCRAERGNPAANISWSLFGNHSVTQQHDTDGFVAVESRLELPDGTDRENLTCIVRHQFWDQEKILVPELKEGILTWYLFAIFGVIFILLSGFTVIAIKKVIFSRQCQQADTSSKSPPTDEVEEVEPYASYVQRVNSIYN